MRVLNISQFEQTLVLYFQTNGQRINAYTLASVLVSVADAAKAANSTVNPGYDVEVVVEALGPGSFRAKITAVYEKAGNLFSDRCVQAVLLGILANFIYERALSIDDSVKIEIHTNEVIIEHGEDRVVVPRQVYESTRHAEKNPQFVKGIARVFEAVAEDERITGFGLAPSMDSPPPEVVIPRSKMQQMAIMPEDDPSTRVVEDQCSLVIVKAILEKSRRKWEFVWRGVRISAPILDENFYCDFTDHKITIAPGDELQVRLRMKQTRDPKAGIYTNYAYEVSEVLEHKTGIRQNPLSFDSEVGE